MDQPILTPAKAWPFWRKLAFRFFFIYITLQIAPWTWLDGIPVVAKVTKYYYQLQDWSVAKGNALLFHVKKELVPINGSGDTSYGWAQLWLFLFLAVVGALIWSIIDRKRPAYRQLNYWLCLFTRYYIALIAFLYGLLKIFALQMSFPNLSQLATPLGDLLPMRLSWMFIGYSHSYQVFSGCMEVLAGLLLLFRRTATLGVVLSFFVFTNVMMMNLSYDIPVKIFSMQMVLLCLFLLVNEWERLVCFFLLNKTTGSCVLYQPPHQPKWMRIASVILKLGFIYIAIFLQIKDDIKYKKQVYVDTAVFPLDKGIYDVKTFIKNRDTLPPLVNDSVRWHEMIFDRNGSGSLKTQDTSFKRLYNRVYYSYTTDTVKRVIALKFRGASIAEFIYEPGGQGELWLKGTFKTDSIQILLQKSSRHFQLAERQFHWLSEQNR